LSGGKIIPVLYCVFTVIRIRLVWLENLNVLNKKTFMVHLILLVTLLLRCAFIYLLYVKQIERYKYLKAGCCTCHFTVEFFLASTTLK